MAKLEVKNWECCYVLLTKKFPWVLLVIWGGGNFKHFFGKYQKHQYHSLSSARIGSNHKPHAWSGEKARGIDAFDLIVCQCDLYLLNSYRSRYNFLISLKSNKQYILYFWNLWFSFYSFILCSSSSIFLNCCESTCFVYWSLFIGKWLL